MKKKIIALALFSSVFLTACDQGASENDSESSSSSSEVTESQPAESQSESTTEEEQAESDTAEAEPIDYQYQINPDTFSVESIREEEAADEPLALLTFDDAPDGNALEIAHKLNERDVSAIFFVNGMYIESDEGKQALKEIHDMGFEIGNHTHTHANLQTISEEQQREEILKTNELVEEILGEKPRFFRAPHGANTEFTEQLVAEEDMVLMNWSFGYDFQPDYQTAEALTDITLNTELLSDGANILMHDRTWTNEAIVPILDGLKEKGFTFVDPKLIVSPESEEM